MIIANKFIRTRRGGALRFVAATATTNIKSMSVCYELNALSLSLRDVQRQRERKRVRERVRWSEMHTNSIFAVFDFN